MGELKTRPTDRDVTEFLNTVQDEEKRKDCFTLQLAINNRYLPICRLRQAT